MVGSGGCNAYLDQENLIDKIKYKSMRFLIIPILILCMSFSLFGQEKLSITGRVTENGSGSPLPGASVIIKGTTSGCITTPNGYFRLIIPNANIVIQFSFIGYETKEVNLKDINIHDPVNISLELNKQELSEVSVISEKEKIIRMSDTEISTVALSPKLIEKLPNFGEVDIMRSFQLLPGISASNETSAGLFVRGGTPDQNLILFDGMSVYHVDHFYGFFSAFNSNSIDDVKLYKGCYPAKYGGRLASVMELKGKSADIDQLNWSAGISLLSVNGMVEVPLVKNKLSLQISGRRSYTDIIKSGLYKNIFALYDNSSQTTSTQGNGPFGRMTVEAEPTFYFYDVNSKLTWFASKKDELSLAFYGGKDVLDNSRENNFGGMGFGNQTGTTTQNTTTKTIDESGWGNIGYSLQWKRNWSKNLSSNMAVSHSKYFSNRERGTETDGSDTIGIRSFSFFEDNNVKDLSVSLDNEWKISKKNTFEFGGKFTQNDITYQYALNDSTFLLNEDEKGLIYAAYAQDEFEILKKVNVNAGLRLSYFNMTDRMYLEPRLTLTYHFANKLKFDLGWGLYNQFIARTVREDIMAGSNDFWMLAGSDKVPVSNSSQYMSGLTYEGPMFHFSIEGYYKDLNGLSEFTMRYSNRRFGDETQKTFFTGSGVAKGIEILAQKKAGKLTGWIAYTLGSVVHNFPEINNGKDFYANHDQTHEVKAVLTQSVRNWDFSVTWIYATGAPYTAPEGVYELEMLDGEVLTFIHVGDKNAYRLPDYHRMDLSANYNFYIWNARAILGFSVFNVYNHTNIWYKEFEFDSDSGDLIETDVKKLGFTPNLSFKVYLR
jgi:ferric enterobactin receptor